MYTNCTSNRVYMKNQTRGTQRQPHEPACPYPDSVLSGARPAILDARRNGVQSGLLLGATRWHGLGSRADNLT